MIREFLKDALALVFMIVALVGVGFIMWGMQ